MGWSSSCTQGTGVLKCIPQEAWLGLYLREEQPVVKCFRVLQPLGAIRMVILLLS